MVGLYVCAIECRFYLPNQRPSVTHLSIETKKKKKQSKVTQVGQGATRSAALLVDLC